MWPEVIEVARVEGVEAKARALHLDHARLAARMTEIGAAAGERPAEAGGGFVELEAGRLGLSPRTVIRFHGRDGERLEVVLATGAAIDLATRASAGQSASAGWSRRSLASAYRRCPLCSLASTSVSPESTPSV
jgi:hypothetical protein